MILCCCTLTVVSDCCVRPMWHTSGQQLHGQLAHLQASLYPSLDSCSCCALSMCCHSKYHSISVPGLNNRSLLDYSCSSGCKGPLGLDAVLQWLLLQLVLVHAATAWLDADGKPLQHFVIKRKLHKLPVRIQQQAHPKVIWGLLTVI